MNRPTALIILDGLGYRKAHAHNAVARAHTPTLAFVREHYPCVHIKAAGSAVGLREGTVGNSEVGHLTIGTGRIIQQPSVLLDKLIAQKKLIKLPVIYDNFCALARTQQTLHCLGLISDAGVHAHIDHMLAIVDVAQACHIKHIALHCFLDGRDTPPRSAATYLEKIQNHLRHAPNAFIASICGRFYAMDRNKEWARTQQAYAMLTQKENMTFSNWRTALDHYYAQNITDEFVPPTQLDHRGIIQDGDGIVFTNYRQDRARQLVHAFLDEPFQHFRRVHKKLTFFITPTLIDPSAVTETILDQAPIAHTLMDILHEHGITSMAIAETEKYAHVTYFFNAGREEPYATEQWKIIPSITARTYEQHPCMRAPEITHAVLESLVQTPRDFYVINYANPDMVGHSGNQQATIQAIECLDHQLKKLLDAFVNDRHGTIFLTADHGNAELMYDEVNKQPHTAHTTNPVEFFFISQQTFDKKIQLPLTGLKDIAPFILQQFHVPVPLQMAD